MQLVKIKNRLVLIHIQHDDQPAQDKLGYSVIRQNIDVLLVLVLWSSKADYKASAKPFYE
jgi:hypothetical protein